jgi:hypothetical protein
MSIHGALVLARATSDRKPFRRAVGAPAGAAHDASSYNDQPERYGGLMYSFASGWFVKRMF